MAIIRQNSVLKINEVLALFPETTTNIEAMKNHICTCLEDLQEKQKT